MKVVAPNVNSVINPSGKFYTAENACKALDKDLTILNFEETVSIAANWKNLLRLPPDGGSFWSSEGVANSSDKALAITIGNMWVYPVPATSSYPIVCTKR